jgi:hypothetical protein
MQWSQGRSKGGGAGGPGPPQNPSGPPQKKSKTHQKQDTSAISIYHLSVI